MIQAFAVMQRSRPPQTGRFDVATRLLNLTDLLLVLVLA